MSYSGVARQMGRPGLQRMVGYALRSLAGSDHDVPWWRVVNAQGRISNAYGPETQRERLQAEGITVSDKLLLDLPKYDAEELVSARLQARRDERGHAHKEQGPVAQGMHGTRRLDEGAAGRDDGSVHGVSPLARWALQGP